MNPRALAAVALLLAAACARPAALLELSQPAGRAQEPAPAPTLGAGELRCEHQLEPLALDTRVPRFSWKLTALDPERRGLAQSAYRILVSASEAELAAERGTLWDSGKVSSHATIEVEYGGRALESFEHALWQVRVWDQDSAASAWSAPARFGTGAFEPAAWQAEWIGFDAPLASARPVPDLGTARWIHAAGGEREIVLRHRFELAGPVDPQAVLVLAAADEYEAFLNGASVRAPSASNPGVRRNADIAKVAQHLKSGSNVLAVRVRTHAEAPAALRCRLLLAPAVGTEILSGADWRVSASAREGFAQPELDDGAWPAATLAQDEPWLPEVDPPAAFLPPPRVLRGVFEARARPVRATLFTSALGVYALELNGAPAHSDWFAPGWTDYTRRIPYRAYDVSALVRAGENVLGVVLADGWYAGLLGKSGQRNHYGPSPRFLGQLVLEHADGTREIFASGADWRASTGPWREADLFMGERYDARLARPGWSAPGFDAADWSPVDVGVVGAASAAPLVAHPGARIEVIAELAPVAVSAGSQGRVLYDFGQNLAGVARLTVEAPAGTTLVLRFAEALEADGTPMRRNLTWARASDQYFCRGGGPETWQPRFTYHGFRYVELAGLPEGAARPTLTALALSSAGRDVGEFRCSDARLERLVELARWTLRANSMDFPTDSPQRGERLGWTGDAQLFGPSALWLADLHTLYDKWSLDLLDAQREDGRFPNTAPSFPGMPPGGPAWEDAGVLMPALLHELLGDRRLAERQYESMARFVGALEQRAGEEITAPDEVEGYGDWRNFGAETPREVLWLAYFARSTRRLAEVARALGRTGEGERLEALLARIRSSAATSLVDAEGRVRGETQTAYALSLRERLVPEALRALAARRFAANVEQRGHLTTGFVGTPEILPALGEIGRADLAYRLLQRRELPSWGFMLDQGATTIWERWDAWTPEAGFADGGRPSLSHTVFGAFVAWLFEGVAGIRPSAPGFASVAFAPTPGGGLAWAEARHDSVRGRVALRWEIAGEELRVELEVPPNVTATLALALGPGGTLREGGRALDAARGVRELGRIGGRVLVGLSSGRFSFSATEPVLAR